MRILIAPDKFKGTLTAQEAATAIARGWAKARPTDKLTLLPISDGGDGFGAVTGAISKAKSCHIKTLDAAHRPSTATWWWQPKSRTAVIESANIIGLAMLPRGKFHPFQLDTFGLGAVLQAAIKKGARRIIVGIGGSATNDGGFGLARALGWKFIDRTGQEICGWTELSTLAKIQRSARFPKGLITVAVDVQNPLLGRHGASRIYGPQKGLRSEDFAQAERSLSRLAQVLNRQFQLDFANHPGAGAAGGLGFGLMTFANAQLASGFDLFAAQAKLDRLLARTDLILTAEGAIDRSTLMGKGAGQIASRAQTRNIPVWGFAGILRDAAKLKRLFQKTAALADLTTPEQAQRRAAFWLERLAFQTAAKIPAAATESGLASARPAAKLKA